MPPKRSGKRQAPRNPRTCPRNEIQHRVKKDAAGQVAVSVRIYEVLGYFAILGPGVRDLDVTARINERTPHYVEGRDREQYQEFPQAVPSCARWIANDGACATRRSAKCQNDQTVQGSMPVAQGEIRLSCSRLGTQHVANPRVEKSGH